MNWPTDVNPVEAGYIITFGDGRNAKEFVTQTGLIALSDEKFGEGEWWVRAELPTADEVKLIRAMLRLSEDSELVVVRGVLETNSGAKFVNFGTTTKANLKGFISFSDYPIEMASTRALNRTMRIAVGAPASVDELYDRNDPTARFGKTSNSGEPSNFGEPPRQNNQPQQEKPDPNKGRAGNPNKPATQGQLTALKNIVDNPKTNPALALSIETALENGSVSDADVQGFFSELNK